MLDDLIQASEGLRRQLLGAIAASESGAAFDLIGFDQQLSAVGEARTAAAVDLIVIANEINSRHGTGVLLQRIFPETKAMVAVRSQTQYRGEQNFDGPSFCLPRPGLSRQRIFHQLLQWLGKLDVRRILCVPYYPDDVLMAIAAKDIFNVPLCTYVMDDQNITCQGIPDELMRELLSKSQLRLAISPEMRTAYEAKYRQKFWLVPPLVAHELISAEPSAPSGGPRFAHVGVLGGNIWGQRWLDLLRKTVRGSGIKIEWYCNGGSSPSWLNFDPKELEADGIVINDPLPEREMAAILRRHAFALLPSGTLDKKDDNSSVATLSLPTRVAFTIAASNTPVLVMGNAKTAAANFIRRFELGETCDYETSSFLAAVDRLARPEAQARYRRNAAKMAPGFSAAGAAQWIWDSLANAQPVDLRFEELIPRGSEFAYYVEPPAPAGLIEDLVPTYEALRRLKNRGLDPDFVLDIGASTGIWSHDISPLFPRARFVLVEPIALRYEKGSLDHHMKAHANFELVEVALGDKPGKAEFTVSSNLYGSSLLRFSEENAQASEIANVEVTTLDMLSKRKRIQGRGLVKMDVQGAEHLIIAGGREFLTAQTDAVIIELSLCQLYSEAKVFLEMVNLMDSLGFRYYDDAGGWRSAKDGTLLQKDGLFLRRDLFPST